MTAISLGSPHCCACTVVCFHIGPMRLCDAHRHPASIMTRYPKG